MFFFFLVSLATAVSFILHFVTNLLLCKYVRSFILSLLDSNVAVVGWFLILIIFMIFVASAANAAGANFFFIAIAIDAVVLFSSYSFFFQTELCVSNNTTKIIH